MKLMIASDIHGSLSAAERVIELYQSSGATGLILLGDLLNHGPRNPVPDSYLPVQVAKLLNPYAKEIIAVRGNCDSEVDQMLLDFPMMEDFSWVMLESGQRFFLTHGHLYNQDNLPPLAKNDVLIHGHTHVPVARSCSEYYWFNPGSVTFPRGDLPPSYGLFESGCLKVLSLLNGEEIEAICF
ncbi:Phosphodiesterase YfcE [Vibrio aerogenes CECT 7868]|uniref:Phosphoesterase n=1 Tax=Vibrio aerogenes CECT 7868 TaxID=1216006 RepID=A0A1M5Z033_9VIBR|nr:phosphodiesterase [Vibrio aerogenes]SHI17615.1 Phosphodiesterase YfcE [Vibrio aerogenes CECT 7868]